MPKADEMDVTMFREILKRSSYMDFRHGAQFVNLKGLSQFSYTGETRNYKYTKRFFKKHKVIRKRKFS